MAVAPRPNPAAMSHGLVILEEAGGKATDMKDNPATVRAPHLLTSNGFLHGETLELFARIFAGDYPFPIVEMPASGT